MTRTHTYVILPVSAAAFEEIKGKLVAADYVRSDQTTFDMTGIALVREVEAVETVEAVAAVRMRAALTRRIASLPIPSRFEAIP